MSICGRYDCRLTRRGFTGSGLQPAMDRAHRRAFSLSVMPGKQAAQFDRGR